MAATPRQFFSSPTHQMQPRHSMLETVLRQQDHDVSLFSINKRIALLNEVHGADAGMRQQYVELLGELRSVDLLPDEFAFLTSARDTRPIHGSSNTNLHSGNGNGNGDDDVVSVVSTTLTDMNLENGSLQKPTHLRKINEDFQRRNESPAQPLPRRKQRGARGSGSSRREPQQADDLVASLEAQTRMVDPSAASDAGTVQSAPPDAYYGGGGGGSSSIDDIYRNNYNDTPASAPPVAPRHSRCDSLDEIAELQCRRDEVVTEYQAALTVAIDKDVQIRNIDAKLLQLRGGATRDGSM